MENLILTQDGNAALLQQAINNYKKSGLDRRTVEYVTRKEKEIDELWQAFATMDQQMRSDDSLPQDHPYFQREIFAILRAKYDEVKAKMKSDMLVTAAMEGTSSQDANQNSAGTSASTKTTSKEGMSRSSTSPSSLITKQQRVIDTVQKMLEQVINDSEPRSNQFYNMKLKTVEQHWRHAQQLHEQIWTSTEDAKHYDFDYYLSVEDRVNEGILQLQEKKGETSISSLSLRQPERNAALTSGIRLPKIEIPTFNGDYLKWRQFRDLFVELIHSQPLASCQKMWYLKSTVSSEASKLIQHFTTTDDNYEAAWTTLNNRYENKRLLVNALLQKLLSQPQCLKDNTNSIKTFHDTIQECLLGLHSLKIDTASWDPILLHIFTQHLDRTTHMLWEQSLDNPREIPTMKGLLAFLKLRFQSLEAQGSKHHCGNAESTRKSTNRTCEYQTAF